MPQDKLACQNRADQRELAAEIWRDNAVDLEWLVRHEKLTLELTEVYSDDDEDDSDYNINSI